MNPQDLWEVEDAPFQPDIKEAEDETDEDLLEEMLKEQA